MKAKIKKNKKPAKVVIKKPIKKEKMKKNEEQKTVSDKNKKTWTALRGMHDILPKEEKYWKNMYNVSSKLAEYMQFARIETPILEEASLFIRSIGKTTDVVEKEMYVFDDSDGGKICLRPEATASVVRAYVSDGLWNNPQPVKVGIGVRCFVMIDRKPGVIVNLLKSVLKILACLIRPLMLNLS